MYFEDVFYNVVKIYICICNYMKGVYGFWVFLFLFFKMFMNLKKFGGGSIGRVDENSFFLLLE